MIYTYIEINDKKIRNTLSDIVETVPVNEQNAVKILEKWVTDYNELDEIVKNTDKSLAELHDELNGHNLDKRIGHLFDLNYKSLLCTIQEDDTGKLKLSDSISAYFDGELREVVGEENCEDYCEISGEFARLSLQHYKENNK